MFYLVFCVLLGVVFAQSNINDSCVLSSGEKGVCLKLPNCSTAVEALRKGSLPQTCGFEGSSPLVCCQTTGKLPRNPGEISKKKCKEYSEYVYAIIDVLPLIGVKPVRLYECPIESMPLVVGGEKAGPKEFPHMALIGFPNRTEVSWECGGSVISENFILTAAHCLMHPRRHVAPKYVAIGFIDKLNSTGQVVRILETITYNKYNRSELYNDIGLLRVEAMRMNSYVRPACLNTQQDFGMSQTIATGWGNVGNRGPSNDLIKVTLDVFSNKECNQKFSKYGSVLGRGIDDDSMICAGSNTEIKDTCKGDSGGPLQFYHQSSQDGIKCMYDIVGVTSFGKRCGMEKGSPGVYTRVSRFIKWIEDIVWPEELND